MTPYERLLAEELPTGTFGGTRAANTPPRDLTTTDRAAHLAELADAIGARHLHPVPAQPKTDPTTARSAAA